MHLKFTAADKTDVGKQRDQNEDSAYKRVESSEEGDRGLFIVADGMGGYKAGEVASRLAVETVSKALDSFFLRAHLLTRYLTSLPPQQINQQHKKHAS